jgi:hypothetical protein
VKEWLLKNWGRQRRDCYYACTKVLKFITDEDVPANIGISKRPHKNIDGYRYINIFVWFTQKEADEPPVDPGVVFAFSTGGEMGARRYANLDENLPGRLRVLTSSKSQGVLQGMVVNGRISSYVARFPVMGPYVQVFVYNRAAVKRKVSVWGYLVS